MNVLTAPWPFAMWGIDMIGEIKPTESNGHRFILVAIDYFTKWVEAPTLLRCVDKSEAERIMTDLHEGTFGTHSSGHTMAKKILRAGCYWSTMEADCYQHSRTCHKCQVYADKVHVPPVPLNVLTAPWPFVMWGINMIGEIKPTASNGHRLILVAIDYFTKWVEAASLAIVTKNVMARFIRQIGRAHV